MASAGIDLGRNDREGEATTSSLPLVAGVRHEVEDPVGNLSLHNINTHRSATVPPNTTTTTTTTGGAQPIEAGAGAGEAAVNIADISEGGRDGGALSRYSPENERLACAALIAGRSEVSLSDRKVAKELERLHNIKRSPKWVYGIRQKMMNGEGVRDVEGQSYYKRKRDTEYDHGACLHAMKEVMKVSETHLTYAELGSEIGISESTARRIMKDANLEGPHDRENPAVN